MSGGALNSPWQKSSRHSTVPASRRTALRLGHILPGMLPHRAWSTNTSRRAQERSRCSRDFHHGLLTARGKSRHGIRPSLHRARTALRLGHILPGMLPHRAWSGGRRNGLGARGRAQERSRCSTFTTDCQPNTSLTLPKKPSLSWSDFSRASSWSSNSRCSRLSRLGKVTFILTN